MNSPEPYDPEELIPIPTQRRFGPWSKLGGGALTFAILIHVIVLTIAGIWIYTVLPPPEPPIITAGKTVSDTQTNKPSKSSPAKATQIILSSDLKRIIAEGAESPISIADSGDNFGKRTPLDSLPGGGPPGLNGGPGNGPRDGDGPGFCTDGVPPFDRIPLTWASAVPRPTVSNASRKTAALPPVRMASAMATSPSPAWACSATRCGTREAPWKSARPRNTC